MLSFWWDFLQWTWRSTVAAMGTTTLAIMVAVAIPLLLLLLEWFTKGWAAMKQRWRNNLLVVAAATLAAWAAIFGYRAWTVRREIYATAERVIVPTFGQLLSPDFAFAKTPRQRHKFTPQELAEFGSGIAIQIVENEDTPADREPQYRPLATGFWINSKGYAVTCARSISGHERVLLAAVPVPPMLGHMAIVAAGATYTAAEIVRVDEQSELALLRVYGNPFERRMHALAIARNVKSGVVESTAERYWPPKLASGLAKGGDDVVRIGFTSDSLPVINPEFGRINRANVDTSKSRKSFRLYTSLPFKESNCGSPIINDAKEVVGVIGGVDPASPYVQPREMAIPARYVLDLLRESQIHVGDASEN